VARLLGALADRGPALEAPRLPVTIEATDAVESRLLAKRDGNSHLLLWRPAALCRSHRRP
jgi:hypothetical protein